MMNLLGISRYAIKYKGFLDKASNSLKSSEVMGKQCKAVRVGAGYCTLLVAKEVILLNSFRG